MIDWHDLRYLLAIGRGVSTAEAARRLRVDPSTVSRKLAALESGLGVAIFDRSGKFVRLTAAGEKVFEQAIAVERGIEALAATAAAAAAGADPVPVVRLSAVPILTNRLLAPALPLLDRTHVRVELIADADNVRFDCREVDIALRFGRPRQGAAFVRRIAAIQYAAYRSDAAPSDIGWIVFDKTLAHLAHAETATIFGDREGVALVVNDGETMLAAAKAGAGRALLPCFAADRVPELTRIDDAFARDLWLVAHAETRTAPPVKTVIDWLDMVLRDKG